MPAAVRDPIPQWLKDLGPANASVFDSTAKAWLRRLVGLSGVADPQAQVAAPMTPMETGPAGGLVGLLGKAIRAYHGSPHDFDRFDLSKIGTGEGAQAYGHGLYFAENEDVAKSYRDQLAKGFEYAGQPVDPHSSLGRTLDFLNSNYRPGEDVSAILPRRIQELREHAAFMRRAEPGWGSDALYDRAADQLSQLDPTQLRRGGRMYEVNLRVDPQQLLDWDALARDQPEPVKRAIADLWQSKGGSLEGRDLPPFAAHSGATGDSLYSAIATTYGPKTGRDAALQQAGSEALNRAGVPGIRYLDQGSRAAGTGTRNYTIFDDARIAILRKYGILPPVVGAGALSALASDPARDSTATPPPVAPPAVVPPRR